MKLYFLRHANADWPDWSGPDDERPLTSKGRKQTRRVAKLLRRLDVKPADLLSSPLPRAFQTAEIVAAKVGLPLIKEPRLGKGFTVGKLRVIIKRAKGEDLLLVGHEPDFSAVIGQLTGGRVKLPKAGIACVELEDGKRAGVLLWLFPAAFAKL